MKYLYENINSLEYVPWNYPKCERENVDFSNKTNSRYIFSEGMWRNPASQNTGRAKLILAGELRCQNRLIDAKKMSGENEDYNFTSSFRPLKGVLSSADLSVGNLATVVHPNAPYANEKGKIGEHDNHNAPPQYLAALRFAGFDLLTTANPHTLDTGMRGVYSTCQTLDQFNFIHTGSYTNTDLPRFSLVNVNGINVGFLSYTLSYHFSAATHITPQGINDVLNLYSPQKATEDIAQLRKVGADFIICYIHWGAEIDKQHSIAQELADAGANYLIGLTADAVQSYDVITASDLRKVPVIYSAGGFPSIAPDEAERTALVIELDLERNSDGSIQVTDQYLPCYTHQSFANIAFSSFPLTNRRYLYERTNRAVREMKKHVCGVVGERISCSTTFDLPPSQRVMSQKSPAYDFPFATPAAIQKEMLANYRLSDEFRTAYGNEVIARNPNGKSVASAIAVIKKFTRQPASLENDRALIADLIYTKNVLGFRFWEYFAYGLGNKTIKERIEFIPEDARFTYYKKLNPNREYTRILDDKFLAYKALKPYYKRMMIKISSAEDLESFREFCSKTERFIVKPIRGCVGAGIQIINLADFDSVEELFENLLETYTDTETGKFSNLVCEELIVNAPSMSAIHPESVNSLRVFTYFDDVDAHIVCAWLKAGRGEAVVDNGSTGGIVAAIDIDTGIVSTHAHDEANRTFITHPDTGFVFKDTQIECWGEAVSMAKEAAKQIPEVRCIGWDIALSKDKGWQLIEGNSWGMFTVLQIATRKGMRSDFEAAVEWNRYK